MDYLTNKEINKLKGDIAAKDAAIEVEKYNFERLLKNGLGEEIINTLNKPPKQNWWKGLLLKFKRWNLKLKEQREYKKLIKELTYLNNITKIEMEDK